MKFPQPRGARWAVAVVAALCASGCAVARVTVDSAAGGGASPAIEPAPVVMQLDFSQTDDAQARAQRELVEASRALDGTAVFFETGKSELSNEGKLKLRRVAEILRRYPAFRIRIEGNADERGTDALNHELGQKRACNARDYLMSLEIGPTQVSCVSNGELRPVAPGHGEQDWQLNRRNDVVPVQDKQ